MMTAIAKRYEDAQQPPPHTIYQDKECCSGIRETGSSVHVVDERSPPQHTHRRETKMLKLYRRLNPFIVLKLDIFHWMRRLLRGITNEKHAFVPGFFREIRLAVFVLFKEDFDRLIQAIMTVRKCDNARAEGLVTREEVCRFVQKNVPRPHILRRRLELVYENYRGATENDVCSTLTCRMCGTSAWYMLTMIASATRRTTVECTTSSKTFTTTGIQILYFQFSPLFGLNLM